MPALRSLDGSAAAVGRILGHTHPVRWASIAMADRDSNRRRTKGDERFLVVRTHLYDPGFYDVVLDWLAHHHPTLRARYELHLQPLPLGDLSRYALHLPWFQDPVQRWSPLAYRLANRTAAACDRHGVPVVNRVDRLLNASKSNGARLIATAGLRTPKMAVLHGAAVDVDPDLPFPVFVRQDWGHGGPILEAADPAELRRLPIGQVRRPVAVERIDVGHGGVYKKFRYIVAGAIGVPQTMHASSTWVVKGDPTHALLDDDIREEEIAYTETPSPIHDRLVAAARALDLDFVAFDYSIDHDGQPVVWEANPYPLLRLHSGRRRYRVPSTVRVMAAMAALHLQRAGLSVPDALAEELDAPGVSGF